MNLPGTIFVATQPVNLRLSFDRLAGVVHAQLRRDPRTGEPTGIFKEAATRLLDTQGAEIQRTAEEEEASEAEQPGSYPEHAGK